MKLASIFRRAVLSLSLVATTACVSGTQKNPATARENTICKDESTLPVAFENAASPLLMGEKMKSMFHDDKAGFLEQWRSMLARHYTLMQNPDNEKALNQWFSQFDDLRDKPLYIQAEEVHHKINAQIYYQEDTNTSATREYWSSPLETLTPLADGYRHADCEDFIILKYFTLRYLGVPAEKMYLAAVNGKTSDSYHAVLLVDESANRTAAATPGRQAFKSNNKKPAFEMYSTTGQYKTPPKKEEDPPAPPRSANAPRPHSIIYYAMNEKGFWHAPENTVPEWGKPKRKLSTCIPVPRSFAHDDGIRMALLR